jgi:Skp family chaperone for outer membrane proteins
MNPLKIPYMHIALLASLTACSAQSADQVATVDVARISANWPKFINYQNQLAADADVLERAHMSDQERKRQSDILQKRYDEMQDEVTGDVRRAAEQIALQRGIKLVTTRETLGYGGIDITGDVEKSLKIIEASPKTTP